MQFSHLHNHSQFSLLDGASPIPKLFKKAQGDNMPALALTDHGNMFGVFSFVAEAWKNTKVVGKDADGKDILEPTVKPIVGCEFYVVKDHTKRSFTKDEGRDRRFHQLMLAKNEIGYKNLVKLCSLGYMDGLYGKYPRIDKEQILAHHEGLIATTCCIGAEVPRTILDKGEEEGEQIFKWYLDLFGEDYFIELQRHGIPEQDKVNEVLLRFSKKYNVPVIAANDSHYVDQEDANAHDILLCINTGEKQSTPKIKDGGPDDDGGKKNGRFAFFNDQFYFKKQTEMETLFKDIPQAIDNTQMVVDKIKALKLTQDILLPHFEVPTKYNDNQMAYLRDLTWEGAHRRYEEITEEIEERINFELNTIDIMGFAGYFLIVWDFIREGRDLGVFIGPGRGSAAGSVIAYLLGITNIDPIKYQLLFERFLNPERKSMPDIDTDFDDAGRQKVIDYVVEKYGKKQVAHIITYGTMAAKMSIKDVARVLDLPLQESNALAKLVPDKPGISLKRVLHAPIDKSTDSEKSLKEKEGLQEEDLQNIQQIRAIMAQTGTLASDVLHSAEILEGSVRNTGLHACGIIIAPKDLSEIVPVSMAKDSDLLVTQYECNVIENAGVIKMDFLGLKTLSILKDAIELVKLNYGHTIVLDDMPLDDALTYELYQRGDTNGTFQFESLGMQKYLKELKPDKIEDLIAMNALYRPGPIQYIPDFIDRKHGRKPIEYDLPEMEEHLKETYGITVYQEQVMLLSQKLAGFSKGDADVLRKAMGKKQIAVLNKMEEKFVEGATKNGHPKDKLKKIWEDWKAFAQYAFNKSHATCYAIVSYQTGYMKAHYPSEYMAAVMNNASSIEKITFFMEECKRMGLKVLGPDVNESLKGFAVNKEGVIRFGMGAIKGVGEAAVEDILKERNENGEFSTVFDLISRVNLRTVNKRTLENLVLAGAFDCFKDFHRAQYFHAPPLDPVSGLERITRFGQQVQSGASLAVNSLFGEMEMPDIKAPELPNCDSWGLAEMLEKEKDVIGIYLSGHPLDGFRFEMTHYNFTPIKELENRVGASLRIAGFLSGAQVLTTKKGDKFVKFTINDYTGSMDITLWRENYVRWNNFIEDGQKIMIAGKYQEARFRPGTMEFMVTDFVLLSEVKNRFTKKVKVMLPLERVDVDFINFLHENLKANPGNCDFNISVQDEEHNEVNLKCSSHGKLMLNDALTDYLDGLLETGLQYKIEVN